MASIRLVHEADCSTEQHKENYSDNKLDQDQAPEPDHECLAATGRLLSEFRTEHPDAHKHANRERQHQLRA
jgi:hypothetical protein